MPQVWFHRSQRHLKPKTSFQIDARYFSVFSRKCRCTCIATCFNVNGTLRRSTLSLGQEIPEWSSPEPPPTSLERPRACHPRNVRRLYAARRYLSALQAARENRRLNRHVPGDSHRRSRETTRGNDGENVRVTKQNRPIAWSEDRERGGFR
ncbi:hypothetical protein K0M31_004754 [Melipona bicolor]|uniref:Uncharacterized protein n=1 Tax=Melipona bicolor TaxID=60889 RepID=A0AA40KMS0_9HYME|nr:hypothetical protein K0M31_004754 [Melipona bicolor]